MNRHLRLEARIMYDGGSYHGDTFEMWLSSDGNSRGYDSYKQCGDNPSANYQLKKFMPSSNVELSW